MDSNKDRPWEKWSNEAEDEFGAYCDVVGWQRWLVDVEPGLADVVFAMPNNLDLRLYCLMSAIADGGHIKTAAENVADVREAIEWAKGCREMPTPAGAAK